jgi:hypothetical protein
MGKAHGWQTLPKCKAGLGYITLLYAPYLGYMPLPWGFTIHVMIFL